LSAEIDAMRGAAIALVNSVLREANIPPVEGIRRWPPT
jgi:hypothetical protein